VELFGGDNMPLRGKGRKSQMFMRGVTNTQIGFGDLTTVIDQDLVAGVDVNQLVSSVAVKTYIDEYSLTIPPGTATDNNNIQYDSAEGDWVAKTYIDFDKITAPADPSTEEGRLYLKEINTANNALAVKLQKAGNIVEVELTSPGCVCECGSTDGAKDPLYDFTRGKMVVELYCGHSYEMDIPNLRRIQ
jgi:hypothetical protein